MLTWEMLFRSLMYDDSWRRAKKNWTIVCIMSHLHLFFPRTKTISILIVMVFIVKFTGCYFILKAYEIVGSQGGRTFWSTFYFHSSG